METETRKLLIRQWLNAYRTLISGEGAQWLEHCYLFARCLSPWSTVQDPDPTQGLWGY